MAENPIDSLQNFPLLPPSEKEALMAFDREIQQDIARHQERLRAILPTTFQNDPEIATFALGPAPTTVEAMAWTQRLAEAIRAFFLRQVSG